MLNTLAVLPSSFRSNPIIGELAQTAYDYWFSEVLGRFELALTIGFRQALPLDSAGWQTLSVPKVIADQLPNALADFLLMSVGAVPDFYLSSWPVAVKLRVADNFLSEVSGHRATNMGLANTLNLFVVENYLPEVDVIYRGLRSTGLDIETSQMHLRGWDSIQTGLNFDALDRASDQFKTLEIVANYHNPAGLGTYQTDWTEFRADFSRAGDGAS